MTREDLLARLGQLLAERRADDGPLGVMLVRLQRLREFRIAHGFAASERMAAAVRELIGEVLRPGDELHQIDGGEFAVVDLRHHARGTAQVEAGAGAGRGGRHVGGPGWFPEYTCICT